MVWLFGRMTFRLLAVGLTFRSYVTMFRSCYIFRMMYTLDYTKYNIFLAKLANVLNFSFISYIKLPPSVVFTSTFCCTLVHL